jgi:DNA polymerase-3 subunit delta'
MFEDFCGNRRVVQALARMIEQDRLPQTLLLAGPEGIGKATLARRLAAVLLGGASKIEQDDLSLPQNQERIREREKWTSEKRAEEPLFFGTHPDFLTFPPEGPLRQISIQQMRLLKEQAQFKPLQGRRRVFLIDRLDRANEQAAHSLLKILEEPPEHLVLVATAENPQDLLPTIRSRSVTLYLTPLPAEQVEAFVARRGLDQPARRASLADGCPGRALTLELDSEERRAKAMLALLKAAAGLAPFHAWLEHSDEVVQGREERLEHYLTVLYRLLSDVLQLQFDGARIRHPELKAELQSVSKHTRFEWIVSAVRKTDELLGLLRRNIQKQIALDAFVLSLRSV